MSRILITGAGGGIAKAILPVLHDLGHSMLLTTRSRTAALESFLKDTGIDAPIFQADLTVESDVDALFEWVAENGGLDVLVNNAGIAHAAAGAAVILSTAPSSKRSTRSPAKSRAAGGAKSAIC